MIRTIYAIYDNEGKTADRYWVIIRSVADNDDVSYEHYSMSRDPQSPQGINQYSHTNSYPNPPRDNSVVISPNDCNQQVSMAILGRL